jgi:tetratricopeptide (TPR) repeat protein
VIARIAALALALGAVTASATASAPRARLDAANGAYRAGDFAAAAAGYEAVLAAGWESPTVHLNLGNARLRLGHRGLAAASYSRALRLEPRDRDARANLRLARLNTTGGIAGAAPLPVLARAGEVVPEGVLVGVLALAWALLWVVLALRRRAPAGTRGPLAALAVATALAAAAAAALLAGSTLARRSLVAVVTAPTAGLRDGPEPVLRPVRELPEATALRVLETREDALRVRTEDGVEGWVRAEDLERL